MSTADWDSLLKHSILVIAAVLLCTGFWLESVPPLREAWRSTKLNGKGAERSVWVRPLPFLAGPAGYMLCVLANVGWFGVSASLAKTSTAPFPVNLLDDSLVATQFAVLLAAGGLVVTEGRFLSLHRPGAGPSAPRRVLGWSISMILAGFIGNGLALLDSHVHVVAGDVQPPSKALGWYWINGVTIAGFGLGAVLALGAYGLRLTKVFDRYVGLGSVVLLLAVAVAALLTWSF